MDWQVIARFWSKVEKTDTCWIWHGTLGSHGYGEFTLYNGYRRRIRIRAHRFAYLITYGYLGQLFACHKCDNRLCVRPTHLFKGTQKANLQDMSVKFRSPNGKLDAAAVKYIRANWRPGVPHYPGNTSTLAKRFGVTDAAISNVARGKSHVLLT